MRSTKIFFSFIVVTCLNTFAAEKEEDSLPLIPPLPHPLQGESSTKCGRVDHMSLQFYIIKSTSLDLLTGNARKEALDGLEKCIQERHNNQISSLYNEEFGAEFHHDQITCSRQKAFGFPETFMVTSLNWRYLHPARIKQCFKQMKEAEDFIKKLQGEPQEKTSSDLHPV